MACADEAYASLLSVHSSHVGCTTANMCIAGYADTDVYTLASGSTVTYDVAAQGGSDWYEVGVVLMQGGSVITQKLFRGDSGSFSGNLATPSAPPGATSSASSSGLTIGPEGRRWEPP